MLFLSLKVPSTKGTGFKKNKLECSINGSVCEALVTVAFNDKKKKNRKKTKINQQNSALNVCSEWYISQ